MHLCVLLEPFIEPHIPTEQSVKIIADSTSLIVHSTSAITDILKSTV
jgi:hypothetical protein